MQREAIETVKKTLQALTWLYDLDGLRPQAEYHRGYFHALQDMLAVLDGDKSWEAIAQRFEQRLSSLCH